MKCPECGSHNKSLNEKIGETCCDECGLVLNFTPFEEVSYLKKLDDSSISDSHGQFHQNMAKNAGFFATNDGLGSHISGKGKLARIQLRQSNKYRGGLSNADKHFQVVVRNLIYQYGIHTESKYDIQKQCMALRRRLQQKHISRGYSAEQMANVITYLVLKSMNISVSINRHSVISGENKKQLSKLSRKWSRHMALPQIHRTRPADSMIMSALSLLESEIGESLDYEFRHKAHVFGVFIENEYDKRNMAYRNSTNAMCIWISSLMEGFAYRQEDIAKVCETTAQTIRLQTRQFYDVFGIDKDTIQQNTVEDFVNGMINKNEKVKK